MTSLTEQEVRDLARVQRLAQVPGADADVVRSLSRVIIALEARVVVLEAQTAAAAAPASSPLPAPTSAPKPAVDAVAWLRERAANYQIVTSYQHGAAGSYARAIAAAISLAAADLEAGSDP